MPEPQLQEPTDAIVRLTASAICGTNGFDGLQAELARVPYANVGLVKLPDEVTDDEAILLSDIFPTGYQAAEMAEIEPEDVVCVFVCGPVGQFSIWSAKHFGAGRVIAVDAIPDRLALARAQGAEVVNFEEEDPVELISEMTRRRRVRRGDRRARAGARARGAAVAAGLRPAAGARVGGGGRCQGRDDLADRRLPADDDHVPDRRGVHEEPHGHDGQLQAGR